MNNPLIEKAKKLLQNSHEPDLVQGILLHLSDTLTEENFDEYLSRLSQFEPIQYITGKAYFHKYTFQVNSHTLIPRPETEELCEHILNNTPNTLLKILDIGTGSGCIPITLLNERSLWSGKAIDISEAALEVAKKNAHFYQLDDRLTFEKMDVLKAENLPHAELWVSNPPYISIHEKSQLSSQVIDFEPHIALFAENDPLIFYKKMNLLFCENKIVKNLWLEVNQYLCDLTLDIFLQKNLSAKKIEDFSGNPRFIHVSKN